MRVKPFTARTAAAAMDMVRSELGEDAIIISVNDDRTNDCATVLVATDTAEIEKNENPEEHHFDEPTEVDATGLIRQALTFHGVPPRLATTLIKHVHLSKSSGSVQALATALKSIFEFAPLPENRTIMFVGPHGGGKTVTVAKMCTYAKMNGIDFRVATTDRQRAGGMEQLAAFTRILGVDLHVLDTIGMMQVFSSACPSQQPAYIDTQGVNPYSAKDMEALRQLVHAGNAEPVLVLPAGYDPMESAELARPFTEIGVRRLLVTRLDAARRTGGVLGAAFGAQLAFTEVSLSANVTAPLTLLNPDLLAQMILPRADDRNIEPTHFKADS